MTALRRRRGTTKRPTPNPSRQPSPDQIWACYNSKHRGWRVRVKSMSTSRVLFEVLNGPANALHSKQRLPLAAFMNCYQPERVEVESGR